MLGMEKRIHALYGDEVGKEADNPKTVERETAGAARAGVALALLAILMAGAAYFGMDAKVAGLDNKITALAGVETRMAALEERAARLPDEVRQVLVADKVLQMARMAEQITPALTTPEQKAAMAAVMENLARVGQPPLK
ncbi:hypothetical protein G3N56_18595 [Desulfovibrio sulfodismutans]|uniref:Uncharacterized protein n=1 Tax=Desulfolutivibrio sulfodismutans TaxID=63561 RepID=A0A7K3NU17_9BACT|nr:hypothetical protein [Desulfolutivibrio sulfodismutans]NDY58749.1 hypothetical protein [Desulfolutivibrio sulfodismutans]QLA12744.1 hypothetical protein GD606_10890 [Desulfolutivibrio sulfodismutans DSM 3696]